MSIQQALADFTQARRILCAFDFDGVLSEIVPEPDEATAVPGATEAMERLAGLEGVEVAVLSGRIRRELAERFRHPDLILIGEHGADHGDHHPDGLAPLQALIDDLGSLVARAPGSRLELKSRSVVLHTRNVPTDGKDALTTRAKAMVDDDTDISVMEGKEVVEFSVTGTDKGSALLDLANRLDVERTLYVGDDITDEHAFAVLGHDDLAVKVGSGDTVARYRVADPTTVVALVVKLIELRRGQA